ncbi:MAG: DUF4838 domain-containing protein, partial [Verrucomicrobiota bacterium]|nr:DUF4838 domain-containing protein [Verrucomicrobiota bacterium]
LQTALAAVAKKNPVVRADAVVLKRVNQRVYLAGANDESHYFAVASLLQQWGCRWYLPGAFGECIPAQPVLKIGGLDFAYAPPFEVRHYWLSWNADKTGAEDFQRRNFMSSARLAGMGHALGKYTKKLIPPGKTMFNVALSEEATAQEVAAQIEPQYAKGDAGISLAIEDGNYVSDSARDKELQAGIFDKYALQPSNTDAMMTLYNRVAQILRAKHPASPTKLGGMAYANVTLPPQRVTAIEPNIVMWLAPIDIDPNHGMDDPRSPPRQEYREIMERWAQLTQGRLAIYDYDQGQLVWRDLPNPSHYAFAQDVKHYRKAGIVGIGTESRGAAATTFLNLFIRGQLMWDPDANVAALLDEFFPKFYGPASAPMAGYWRAIFAAWENTLSTEHEYFIAPVIYPPPLIAGLRMKLGDAQKALEPLRAKANPAPDEQRYLERMRFTGLSFAVLDNYMAMQRAVSDVDFRIAVEHGERGLAAREELTQMNPTFTTYKKIGERGASWWPGEVQQYRELLALTDGRKGTLLLKTPLEWLFRRDPHDTGLPRGWAYTPADLAFWNTEGKTLSPEERKDYPDAWEMLRTDIYAQGQGVRHPDGHSYTGPYWYQTTVTLDAGQAGGPARLMFPGLFNECWLYLNGELIAHRPFTEPWWRSNYKFEWDVELGEKLRPGANLIALRGRNPHHFGGMFRRPFLYRAGP